MERTQTIRNLSIHYLCSLKHDQGPLIYFLHGFPDNAYVWQSLWEEVGEQFDWIAPHLPGVFNEEKISPTRYSLNNMVLDHLELLSGDELRDRQIVCVGHDLGGPVASELNEALGSRSKGLILLNSFSMKHFKKRVLDPTQLRKSSYMLLFQAGKTVEFLFKKNHKKALNKIYNMGGVSQNDKMRENSSQVFHGVRIYHQYMKNIFSKTSNKKNNNPKLMILGLHDPFITIPHLDEIESHYSNCKLRVLPVNHWPHRDPKNRVGKLICDFLETN